MWRAVVAGVLQGFSKVPLPSDEQVYTFRIYFIE